MCENELSTGRYCNLIITPNQVEYPDCRVPILDSRYNQKKSRDCKMRLANGNNDNQDGNSENKTAH